MPRIYSWDLLSFFFFSSPTLRGHLAHRHQTSSHVRWWPRFIKFGQKNLTELCEISPKFWRFFPEERGHRNATWHRQSKTALQSTDTPAQINLIRFTLVHKRRKIGPEFWHTQWDASSLVWYSIRFWAWSGCDPASFSSRMPIAPPYFIDICQMMSPVLYGFFSVNVSITTFL